MEVPTPRQWEPLAIVPILAGLYWLLGAQIGDWLFWGLLPGALMLSTGVAMLLFPGEIRVTEYMAAGGFVGLVFVLPVLIDGGAEAGLVGGLLAAAAYLTAGRVALVTEQLPEGVPPHDPSLLLDAKVALDEALLAYFVGSAEMPSGQKARAVCERARGVDEALRANGWLERPESFHSAPTVPDRVYVQQARIYGQSYERLSYPSAYTPPAGLPGAAEWAAHHDNHHTAAWVLRHPGPPRPWLVCIHGYRMGEAWLDFALFPPRWLHHRLGLNLLMPVLPLHGPRRIGLRSGDGYLDDDPFDLLLAQSQALWDLRRALMWVRSQEDNARIGVLGYSLGGYNAALLAQYESQLDFLIAGIPVVDFPAAIWRHLPLRHRQYFAAHGLSEEHYREMLRPISPLARPALPGRERLYVFAGSADRVVLPEHPVALAKHWGVPIQWYPGGHLSFRNEVVVRAHIEAAMQRAGWPVSAVLEPAR